MNIRTSLAIAFLSTLLLIAMKAVAPSSGPLNASPAALPTEIVLTTFVGTSSVEAWTGELTFDVDLGVFSYNVDVLPNALGAYTVTLPLEPDDLTELDTVLIHELIVHPSQGEGNVDPKTGFFTSAATGMAGFAQRIELDSDFRANVRLTMSEAPSFGTVTIFPQPPVDANVQVSELNTDGSPSVYLEETLVEEGQLEGTGQPINIFSWRSSGAIWVGVYNSNDYLLGDKILRRGGTAGIDIDTLYETTFSIDPSIVGELWKVVAFDSSGYVPSTAPQLATHQAMSDRLAESKWSAKVIDFTASPLFSEQTELTFELWGGAQIGSASPNYVLLDSRERPTGALDVNIIFD